MALDPTLMAQVVEAREGGKWRRALQLLDSAGRPAIEAEAASLALWLTLKCELGEKRDLGPLVRRLLGQPDLTWEPLGRLLPMLPSELKTELAAELEAWVARAGVAGKELDDFWWQMPTSRWSADRVFAKLAETTEPFRYDALLAEAKQRFAGDPRLAAVKPRPLSDAEIAKRRAKEIAERREAERRKQRDAAARLEGKLRRDERMEAAILAAPGDDAPWQVYADWLQSHGDPRGELATVQLALEKDPANDGLRKRERELLPDVLGGLLGATFAIPAEDGVEVTLGRGFFRSARVSATGSADVEEVLAALLKRPDARFLRELSVGANTRDDNVSYEHFLARLSEFAPSLPLLESLFVGDFDSEECELSWSELGDASPIYAVFPRLRSLILRAGTMRIGAVQSLAELRRFEVRTGGLRRATLAEVLREPFPRLESLSVWFGQEEYGAECTAADLEPLLGGALTPALRHLGLQNAGFTDDLIAVLARSPLLRRLTSLDLSLGALGAAGADALLEHRERFAHLTRLDLSENALDEPDVARLQGLLPGGEVVLAHQDPERNHGDDRYPAVGE